MSKKLIVTIPLLLIALAIFASAAFAKQQSAITERWQERRDGVVVEDREKTTKMLIPDPGATAGEVRSIVRNEGKKLADDIRRGINEEQQKSNVKTWVMIDSANEKVDRLSNKSDAIESSIKDANEKASKIRVGVDSVADDVKALNNKTETLATKDDVIGIKAILGDARQALYICGGVFIAAIILTIVLAIIFRRRRSSGEIIKAINRLGQDIRSETATGFTENAKVIDQIPVKTVRLFKEASPDPFEFDVGEYHITYTSPPERIAEGCYLTLHVAKDPETDNPVDYERVTETHRGKALSSLRSTMKKYFAGVYDLEDTPQNVLQRRLIKYYEDEGSLKIGKIT